ncbi:GntR family transcriptional regulator [Pseudomonas gingeri]|uniref:GntR family transcriptional regulator n=1 Tax=Pseudomonas gingeri TaxID=117681 RepID=UPI0015A0823C|nr:GntR family transcriptional regulator [Pseudomonas gingeri]NWD04155.1 GntR family transcriptional regulator [Pseudomonas gingeri]NWE34213.1 GntR family transcriptional regulator [Pseudomonas gingeri]NWE56535.1 GntR family transcriptional regulator [Pseudomonas gingeri]NWF05751.1 GntR family transcriptional regulator [Pseudomonas gingeri]
MEGMNPRRYAAVAQDLIDSIGSGRYPVGSLLPTELELCTFYQVSRHTIRAAIDQLQGHGMVSRRKRVGTRVEASSPRGGFSQALASVADLVQVAETHVRDIQEVRHFVADIALAKRLGIEPGGHYFCVSSIKVDNSEAHAPLCWTDVYAKQTYAEVIPQAEEHPDELIAALIGKAFSRQIDVVDQQVRPVQLSSEMAGSLKAQSGALGLNIIRQYRDQDGEIIAVSETLYPSDRFTLVMQMKRDKV